MTSQVKERQTIPPAPTQQETPKRRLPLLSERLLSHLPLEWVPDWLKDPFRDRQRQLMAAERKLQRRFLNEYRGQVRSFEPVLKDRGFLIGTAIIDAFTGQTTTTVSYADAAAAQASNQDATTVAFFEQQHVKEMMQTLDPIIAPVLTPFVEGLKTPINEKIGDIQGEVVKVSCFRF